MTTNTTSFGMFSPTFSLFKRDDSKKFDKIRRKQVRTLNSKPINYLFNNFNINYSKSFRLGNAAAGFKRFLL